MENEEQNVDYNVNVKVTNDQDQAPIISVWSWVGVFILMAIPLVNLIVLLVWAFSDGTNPNKKNYARATLLIFVIFILLFFILGINILSNFSFV